MYLMLHYTVCCSNAWSPFEVKLKSIDLCSPIYIIAQNRQDMLVKHVCFNGVSIPLIQIMVEQFLTLNQVTFDLLT